MTTLTIAESDIPLSSVRSGSALAIIRDTEGPAYRPRGAAMVVHDDGGIEGYLSSGCIDHDVARHARDAIADGQPRNLRYGRGSPFRDLELPCGGGLDILVLPHPDPDQVAQALADLAQRKDAFLDIAPNTRIHILPRLRFIVFGAGVEAQIFADMAHASGYQVELFAPDHQAQPSMSGLTSQPLQAGWPKGLTSDHRSAIALFFHDHDQEIALLQQSLSLPAFYIGAMGSHRAHAARMVALSALGVDAQQLERLRYPFGLVPSARNARSLAISVLADILATSEHS